MQSLAAIFSRRAGAVKTSFVATVDADATCSAAAEAMRRAQAGAVIVVDAAGIALGIITERDIARRSEFRDEPGRPATDVMSAPVETINADDFIYQAIGRMRRARLRHMPVVDNAGQIVGLLDLHVAYEASIREMVGLIDKLTHEETIEGLAHVKGAQIALAERLFEENLPAPEIQSLISDTNRDIHGRIIDLLIMEMDADGLGPPPVDFCVIVMGSAGRGESFLMPDQDNGFILDDYPDDQHDDVDTWFRELAGRMVDALNTIGFPYCDGYVMAVNPLWRKTRSQWRAQMDVWFRQRQGASARFADIFFDFVAAWGRRDFADELRAHINESIVKDTGFLRDMFHLQADHSVAQGWLGRLITESSGEHKGKLSLKYRGTLPLVEGVRLMALSHGIAETSTLARLESLAAKGALSRDEQDYLAGGYRHISHILMHRQIDDWRNDREISNFVPAAFLTRRERHHLKDCFRAIGWFRRRLRGDFMGSVL
jgi:CBS domain-containing protein